MARIDELISHVGDTKLREQLKRAVDEMRRRKKFGLVFEEHIPETVLLAGAGVHEGSQVVLRAQPTSATRYVVETLDGDKATIRANGSDKATKVKLDDLLVIKPFGEPVYPVLRQTGAVTRNPGKPYHVVINGENFHALQLLLFTHEGEVDCIYIDPPYNTGARDWTYNNAFVDINDRWRHSKWLSFMEKRLRLAKRLLKPDGVLVVTIDEHEVHHLGMLLDQVLSTARRQMVTIVNNAAGVTQGGFSRVEEYAIFCFMGEARPIPGPDDFLSDEGKAAKAPVWFSMIRYGGINALPSKRPNLVYPIAIDPETNRIVATGPTLKDRVEASEVSGNLNSWRPNSKETVEAYPVVWPFRSDGSVSTWQLNPESLLLLAKDGFVRVRPQKNGPGGNRFSISYIKSGNQKKILSGELVTKGREPNGGPYVVADAEWFGVPKTVWRRTRHDAGKWGSRSLRELLGSVTFDYAKSPYAVLDTLRTIVGANPNALVLDFFAGSGTTLHALAMLNAEDEGARRCLLVTNNQVDEAAGKRLNEQGLHLGDDEFEAHGVARAVTFPRVRAALTGIRPDGQPVDGTYLDGSPIANGLEENAVFFDLDYVDGDRLEFTDELDQIVPVLWLAAGGQGDPTSLELEGDWLLPERAPMAALLDEDRFRAFRTALEKRPDVWHIWLVTDSETAFARMRESLPADRSIGMLTRDYLRNFQINAEVAR
jgi:adenine-specific DNA-methyltransferase